MSLLQKILLSFLLAISLAIQIGTHFYYLHYYYPRVLHIVMLIAIILILLNPKGIRLLVFVFFTYFLFEVLDGGSLRYSDISYALQYCMFGLPLMWLGVGIKAILYIHVGLYAVLAYFSFNNPFKPKVKPDLGVIDDFDQD